MPDVLDSVKALAADYRRWAAASEDENPTRAKRQTGYAEVLEAAASEIETSRKRLRPMSDLGDLSDLPEEVMAQLNLSKVDELEQQLRDIVSSGNGDEVSLDQIIVDLYRRHKVTKQRTYIMNKLYRMVQKGTIESVEGKKGLYRMPTASPISGGYQGELDDDVPF